MNLTANGTESIFRTAYFENAISSKKRCVFLHNHRRIFDFIFAKQSYGLLIYMIIKLRQHNII